MDSWGDRMPLPDADKRSPRVYTNLQNLDLANVTFSNIESTGDPIAIEEANEDELRRLVLCNLARLVCAGEWNGLLTAGGGGGFSEILPLIGGTDADQYNISECPPWNGSVITTQSVTNMRKPIAYPFISPASGTVSAIGITVTAAEASDNVYVAIYSQDSNFLPSTLLGYATIALDSTGNIYQTSLSDTITLTAGQQYWYSLNIDQSSSATLRAMHDAYLPALGITDALDAKHFSIEDDTATDYDPPPSTFDSDPVLDATHSRIVVGLKF